MRVKLWDGLGEASAGLEGREPLRRLCGGEGAEGAKRKAPAFSGFGESVQRSEELSGIPGCPGILWLHSLLPLWLFLVPCDVI